MFEVSSLNFHKLCLTNTLVCWYANLSDMIANYLEFSDSIGIFENFHTILSVSCMFETLDLHQSFTDCMTRFLILLDISSHIKPFKTNKEHF